MTVTVTSTFVRTAGNNVTTVVNFPFLVTSSGDLVVRDILDSTGTPTTLTLNTHYTVHLSATGEGGAVTFLSALVSGHTYDIRSNIPATQGEDIRNQGRFLAEIHEGVFDKAVRLIQDLTRKVGQSIQAPDYEASPPNFTLPNALQRALNYLAFDVNGNAVVTSGTGGGDAALRNDLANTTTAGKGNDLISYRRTLAEIAVSVTPVSYAYPPGNSVRNNVDQTGTADSTTALQEWAKEAFSMFSYLDGQGLWNGGGGACPIITLQPGKIKVSGPTVLPTGATITGLAHPANTTSHTRIVMNSTAVSPPSGAGDNRNKAIFKFSRATILGGVVQDNLYLNTTLQNLELWYVGCGVSTFNAPLSGTGIPFGDYPDGGSLFFDVDCVDSRIVSCCFQHSPAAIRIKNVKSGQVGGDGFNNTNGCNLFIEECEFDTGSSHIYATNSTLDLVFRNCAFYGSVHKYVGCTGRVVYENCRFYGGAYIDATDTGNSFTLFRVAGGQFDQQDGHDSISVYKAVCFEVKMVTFLGAAGNSTIVANFCSSGGIVGNSINDSGFNAGSTTGLGASAAVKMIDCQNMLVAGNNITATDAATYGGFGILTLSSARTSQKNFINGNCISAPYTGVAFNGQARRINVASSADIVGTNYDPNGFTIAKQGPVTIARTGITYSASMTIDASAAVDFVIDASNNTPFTINAPTNPSVNERMTIMIRNVTVGALGLATWNAVFKMAAWVQPVAGASLTIDFLYDGANWVEQRRGATSIPN